MLLLSLRCMSALLKILKKLRFLNLLKQHTPCMICLAALLRYCVCLFLLKISVVCVFYWILVVKHYFVNRNLVSKPRQLELTARQSMEHFPEEMEQYIFVSPIKDIVKKYGIMLLGALSWLVNCYFFSYCIST